MQMSCGEDVCEYHVVPILIQRKKTFVFHANSVWFVPLLLYGLTLEEVFFFFSFLDI